MRGTGCFVAAGSALLIASWLAGTGASGAAAAALAPASRALPFVREHAIKARRLRSRIFKKELWIAWV